jgi:16S rRNA (cytosine1402-N4)-methyltransferase
MLRSPLVPSCHFMEKPHTSVLPEEVIAALAPRPGGVYCDGTLGAGGHAAAILAHSGPDSRLVGIDRDPAALALAGENLRPYGERAILRHGCYGDAPAILAGLGIERVDGFLLDLGVSSMQLDQAGRGFSFSQSGPLDMRMDPSRGETALELLRRLPAPELADILRKFGEERFARRIAEQISEAVRRDAVHTTGELAALVADAMPARARRELRIHPATRTFQALRIAVNRELDELDRFLERFPDHLVPGGRCVVISFHSLEDRLVKHRFRALAWRSSLPPHLAVQAGERVEPICTVLTRKPVCPGAAEIASNPRARSARLRACERLPT